MPIIAKQRVQFARRCSPPTPGPIRGFESNVLAWSFLLAPALLMSACSSGTGASPDWEIELPFNQVDTVALAGDAVFCLGSDGDLSSDFQPLRLVVYSVATGAERFHTILDLRALAARNGEHHPGTFALVEGDVAVVLSQDGRIRAFEATSGRELWNETDIEAVLGSGGGRFYAIGRGYSLLAFDARTGNRTLFDKKQLWMQQLSSSSRVAAMPGRAFVTSGSTIAAIDVPSGIERWVQAIDATNSAIQVSDGFVVVTGRRGWSVFDAETGALRWRFEAYESSRPIPPTLSGSQLLTMRGRASNSELEDGYLRVYELATGELKARFAVAPLPAADDLVAAGGRIYFPSSEFHYGALRRPIVKSTGGDALADTLDVRLSALDAATGRVVWTGEPATWGSIGRPAISDSGFVALAAMTPKRNKPARLLGYRPLFAK